MKRTLLLIVSTCLAIIVTAQQPGATIDVQHYTFSITLNDTSDLVKGNAAIEILFIKDAPAIALDLISENNNHKGQTVLQVTEQGKPLHFTHINNQLTIQFAAPVKSGERRNIEIAYEGIPADGLVITQNKYGHRVFFADNWPNRAHNWLPCVDHPADKASLDFIVIAPAHYQVIANGVKTQDTTINQLRYTHYTETTPLSTKIMVIGVAEFAIQQSGTVNDIPVYSWVYPEEKEKGFYDYALAVDILPYFIKNVGPYAFKKLANVESTTIFGGMENASAIFYSDDASITGTRKSESLLAHEIAHQWFGDMATEADWSHLWLSEGFATYMTILYFEQKHGPDTAKQMLVKNRNMVIDFARKEMRPVVDSSVTNYMKLLNANSYQKGGWVLHMLRRQLGDALFWKGIQTYYSRYSGKNAVTGDLCKVMEEVSGTNLQPFFQQWLFRAGQPKLDITWKYNTAKKEINVTVIQQQNEPYQFPLELQIGNDGIKQLGIRNRETHITWPVTEKPGTVIVDPQVNLLFEGQIKETR
ncbi:peptidase M1 [Niastella yeongjuensis]|uniref:Aminopeptidase N n=1 Tax=Niastella yeongjuensis TaxID=354355 RepID=A0A1V9EN53_9BACT|nr:M1 family metallopeptidase [Niastella yeongjuensis]OQP47556.1 peptidase M1 [Niastella yeongjuensis]SEN73592.1 Peptidase family M1 [Niastella yeongjuensis]